MTAAKIPFSVLVSFAVTLAAAELWALRQPLIAANSNYSLIVTLDLAVVAPAVCFLLVRRRRQLAPSVLIATIVFGGFVSGLLFRDVWTGRGLIVLAVLELLLLAFFAARTVTFIDRVRTGLRAGEPLEQVLHKGLEAAYGRSPALPVLRLALTELFLIYYGIFGSFRRTPNVNPDIFSYHRSQDTGTSLALMLIVAFEAVPVHFLVHQWSSVAAWILTGLSLYTLLWLLGDYQALRLKPIEFTATHLRLYTGLRWQANIALEAVAELVPVDAACNTYVDTSLTKTPRFFLRLKRPTPVFGLFGRRTEATFTGIYVDDPKRFQTRFQNLFKTEL